MTSIVRGSIVKFKPKVFEPPFSPYYDAYKNHTFVVEQLHYDDTHAELSCLTGVVAVAGYVHINDIVIDASALDQEPPFEG